MVGIKDLLNFSLYTCACTSIWGKFTACVGIVLFNVIYVKIAKFRTVVRHDIKLNARYWTLNESCAAGVKLMCFFCEHL